MLVCLKLEIAIVPHAQNCVTEDVELLFRLHRARNRANNTYLRRRCAAEKWAMRDEGPPIGRCALTRGALWGGELEFGGEGFGEFGGEGFGEFWGEAFDGEEVVDGGEGFCLPGLYDAFGEFGADARE